VLRPRARGQQAQRDQQKSRDELDTDLDRQANPMGTLHGGIPCDLADAAMGFTYASTLAEGESFTTLKRKITSGARSGRPA
jgi:acyl-coenzyme A thioesterase PaaI-like protein